MSKGRFTQEINIYIKFLKYSLTLLGNWSILIVILFSLVKPTERKY